MFGGWMPAKNLSFQHCRATKSPDSAGKIRSSGLLRRPPNPTTKVLSMRSALLWPINTHHQLDLHRAGRAAA
jgi:hypothetical protein